MDFDAIEHILRAAHKNVDGFEVKSRVDDVGIDAFISDCAKLGAGTGFAAGFGGGATLAVLIGVDVANYLYQQIRITMAVVYARTGQYRVTFEEVMWYMAVVLGVRIAGATALYAGLHAGKAVTTNLGQRQVMRTVIQEILKRLPASAATKIIPGIGGAIGAGFNYVTLRGYGKALLKLDQARFGTAPGLTSY